ncbi:MAG: alpha/beta hydrolase [Steroidobacteraceae bacterium]
MIPAGASPSGPAAVGDWQGTLVMGPQKLRAVIRIVGGEGGALQGTFYSIDQSPNPFPFSSVALVGADFSFRIDAIGASYSGKINPAGDTISGSFTQFVAPPVPFEMRRATRQTAWSVDDSPHSVQFITVDTDVKLEVLDWRGAGRPLVLLAGLGDTAHAFDRFAPKLTGACHVYGITRRGFGASSIPAAGYCADRLGDDVVAVLDALQLDRPILVGHSIAGAELSSIGSRFPQRVAGLIYLEAGYSYAYYNSARGDLTVDLADLQKQLLQLTPGQGPQDPGALIQDLLDRSLPRFINDLKARQTELQVTPAFLKAAQGSALLAPAVQAIKAGQQKYSAINVPILAFFAEPHALGFPPNPDPNAYAAYRAWMDEYARTQAAAFERGLPSAHIVRLPHASHYIFRSNEADVLREMNAFVAALH